MKKIIILLLATIFTTVAYAASPRSPKNVEVPGSEAEALFSVTGEQIVAQAQRYLGRPYRRGSKGPSAFDCSGFTSYVYKSLNIRLNSCSRSQYTEGISVNRDEVHTGEQGWRRTCRNSNRSERRRQLRLHPRVVFAGRNRVEQHRSLLQ